MVHTASLLRTALRLCREREAAEDLVQDALLRAWKAWEQFEPGTNCKAWLFRIMLNVSSREFSKANGGLHVVSLDDQPEWKEPAATRVADPLSNTDLRAALDSMAEEQRVVLLLAVVEGFTCKEISKILTVPIGTVMSRLSRARLGLRRKLCGSERRPTGAGAHRSPHQAGGMIQ